MSPPVLIVFEQLNYTKPDGIHAIFMPVIIEFSRCICTYSSAKFERIIFKTDICIPMIMPFKGADLSLILGNLLENAVEAAEKVEENRYINVKMKFDKNNLLLFVDNSYKGKLLKTRDNRLKSTKSDAENHGVGLASVYRAVAKYHGSVVIEDSEPGKFKIRIVLYSNVQE